MREVGVHVSILATILTSNCKGKQKVIPEKQMQEDVKANPGMMTEHQSHWSQGQPSSQAVKLEDMN